ncbi:hypothetical protein J7F01_20195 [Streptomyces sp. ISL-22]|uniref:hypothetical protein n=1 Tax=unclassified Streptomyces TaxID=2593676 RepID=UPI001BE584F1|nr:MULTISPECIES: hypothetical protein [unclassified Streptomyces]MBT2423918.1 hypothetical protein [Streptomyces sp. ISL-24]MBT2434451.1 hypothetical protein [Streptomyces sp. ISL-22]
MDIGGQHARLRAAVVGAVIGTAMAMTGCQQAPDGAAKTRAGASEEIRGMAAAAGRSGAACVFVKPDGAQRFGHVGWGFQVTGTRTWVYGAVENPSGRLYTPPGGDIGAWHAEGSYARMLSDMSRDAHYPGRSAHPYRRYRCTPSSTSDVAAARRMIRTVEARGFLVGVDPKTGELTSRDCLDATYDVLKAYRTRRLTPAAEPAVPNVWVESLVGWSDRRLTPR